MMPGVQAWWMLAMLIVSLPVHAQRSVDASSGAVVSLGHGVEYRSKVVSVPVKVQFHLAGFDSSRAQMQVLAATKQAAVPLHRWLEQEQGLAMCNGGYFNPNAFTPTGLEVARGVTVGSYLPFGEWGGAFASRSGVPAILTEKECLSQIPVKVDGFVQCSPMLVDGSRKFPSARDEPRARRTFVAHDGKSRWVMGVTSRVGLGELALLLAGHGPECVGFVVYRALNLDGGPSTGLVCRDSQGKILFHEKEAWRVRNSLIIQPLSAVPTRTGS